MIHLGNNIRELRKTRGLTQEQLATALHCSPQAISKWEMGAGYPDVATLPVIAAYFEISLDALFKYDPEEIEEKIMQVLYDSRINAGFYDLDRAKAILEEGIRKYPQGYILKRELLERYTRNICRKGRTDLVEAALDLGKQLVAECKDSFIYLGVMNDMASIYITGGRYEEGKALIESMPYRYHLDICDRMRCTVMHLRAEDALHEAREWKRWAHQELYLVCEDEGRCFFDTGDYENALYSFREAADLLVRFWDRPIPPEYDLLQGRDIPRGLTTVSIAGCLYRLGRLEECDAALDEAYHLIRDGFSDKEWPPYEAIRMGEYRGTYTRMGLDAYKPCPY